MSDDSGRRSLLYRGYMDLLMNLGKVVCLVRKIVS